MTTFRQGLKRSSFMIVLLSGAVQHRWTLILALVIFVPLSARAERLEWDYSASPKLEMFITNPDPLIFTQDRAPEFVLTRFIVEGSSAEEWTESLEIMNTWKKNQPRNVSGWYEKFKLQGEETCHSDWKILEESKKSLMFERLSESCPPFGVQHAVYRVLYGKKNIFVLFATRKEGMDDGTRDSWIEVLESADIKR